MTNQTFTLHAYIYDGNGDLLRRIHKNLHPRYNVDRAYGRFELAILSKLSAPGMRAHLWVNKHTVTPSGLVEISTYENITLKYTKHLWK